MRQLIEKLRQHPEPVAVLLASRSGEEKVTLVAGISRALIEREASTGNWVREVAKVVGGGGGGRPDLAQAGGKLTAKLPEALEKAQQVAAQMLADSP